MSVLKKCILLTTALVVLVFTSCRTRMKEAEPSEAALIKVSDFRNKEIILTKPATRIVCLIESALSGIYMLQAGSSVAGISTAVYNEGSSEQYAVLDERIRKKELPAPGNWDYASIESIVALQPDLVIIWASQTESIELIERQGIPVYAVMLTSFGDVYTEINDLGLLTGTQQRADSLINITKKYVGRISAVAEPSSGRRKSVYFMWPQGLLETAGTTSTVNELLELAGAENCCTVAREHVVINKEMLSDWNPDVIVMWRNDRLDPADIVNMPEFKYLNAVRNRMVFELPSVFMCDLWTLKFTWAARLIAGWCYPDAFADSDAGKDIEGIFAELYGKKVTELIK